MEPPPRHLAALCLSIRPSVPPFAVSIEQSSPTLGTIIQGICNFVRKKILYLLQLQYSHSSAAPVPHFLPVLHLRPALSYPFQAAGLERDCLLS